MIKKDDDNDNNNHCDYMACSFFSFVRLFRPFVVRLFVRALLGSFCLVIQVFVRLIVRISVVVNILVCLINRSLVVSFVV